LLYILFHIRFVFQVHWEINSKVLVLEIKRSYILTYIINKLMITHGKIYLEFWLKNIIEKKISDGCKNWKLLLKVLKIVKSIKKKKIITTDITCCILSITYPSLITALVTSLNNRKRVYKSGPCIISRADSIQNISTDSL